MNRGETVNQIRRILLLAAGRRGPQSDLNQLELPLAHGQTAVSGAGPGSEELDQIGRNLHELAIELVLLIQMESNGLVDSPLLGKRRRLRLGSAPPLRFLREWSPSPSPPTPAPLETMESVQTSGRRELCFGRGITRGHELVERLELNVPELQEMAKRLYALDLHLGPEDDLPGLIHGHGMRHRLIRTPRGRLAFKIDRERSRGCGVFSTPTDLIQILTRAVIDPAISEDAGGKSRLDEFQFLDPACGSGQFLLAAANRLVEKDDAEPLERLRRLRQVHGVDLDPQAARIAAHNLSVWAAAYCRRELGSSGAGNGESGAVGTELDRLFGDYPYFLGRQIQVGNALLIEPSTFSPGFIWEKRFPRVFDRDNPGFDVVIGNPPWISFGLRDRAAADVEEREYFERLFPAGTQYKLTLYPLFIELALRLCRPGGYHGFLVPDSVLTGHHFSRIRERLLGDSDLIELALVESAPWPGAQVGYTVFYASRLHGSKQPAPTMVRNRVLRASKVSNRNNKRRGFPPSLLQDGPSTAISGARASAAYEGSDVWVPAEQYRTSRGGPLRIFRDREEIDFLARVEQAPLRFGDVIWSYSGMIARHGQKSVQSRHAESRYLLRDRRGREVLVDEDAARRWQPALLSGSEVRPYQVKWAGGRIYLPEGRDDLARIYKSGFHLERYRKPKIFLRQTGDRLIAGLDRSGLYSLNNLHLLASDDSTRVPPSLLVGLLMSRPIQRTYRIFALEGSRPLAQVDLKTVESLPYPCDASGFPIGGGDPPPRTHPRSKKIVRSIDRWLKSDETDAIREMVAAAHALGPEPFDGGPLRGRDVLTLVLLRLLELLEASLASSSSGKKTKIETEVGQLPALQPLLDDLFSILFRLEVPSVV